MKFSGPSRFQFPSSGDVQLADVIAPRTLGEGAQAGTDLERHKAVIQQGQIHLRPTLDFQRVERNGKEQLVLLNASYEQNKLAIAAKAQELSREAKHEYQRVAVNAVEVGVLGGLIGGLVSGAAKGSPFGPAGALIGAGIGCVSGGLYSGAKTYQLQQQRESLKEIGRVIELYDRIRNGTVTGTYVLNELLDLEKTKDNLSKGAVNAHKELERILECMLDPVIVALMKEYALRKNSHELQKVRS